MNLYAFLGFSALFNAITGIMVAIVLYKKKYNSKIAKIFIFQCLLIAAWGMLYFFPFTPENKTLSLLSFYTLHLASNFITVAHFHLVCHVLNIWETHKKYVKAGYLIHLVFWLFIPTQLFIIDIVPKFDLAFWPIPGPLYYIWLVSWSFFIVYPAILLYQHYRKAEGLRKRQLKGFLVGTLVGLSSGSTNYFLFLDINIPPYLNILASVYVCSIAYLIARYRFVNFELNLLHFLQKTLSFSLTIVSLFSLYFYLNQIATIERGGALYLVGLVFALALYHIFESIFTNSRLLSHILRLSDFESFEKAIGDFKEHKTFYSNKKQLEKALDELFIEKIQLESAQIIEQKPLEKNFPKLYKFFQTNKGTLVNEEVELRQAEQKTRIPYASELKKIGEVCCPIHANEKLIGLLVLGDKKVGNYFSLEELNLIDQVGKHLSLSLSAINYNETLKDEVEVKTEQLKKANAKITKSYKKLQELDALKDDFISIASHELRTPMTIIRGYTDFLLSEKFGSVNKQQKEFLTNIFESTKDLIHLTNNMLDISRIEAGTFNVHLEKTDLSKWMKKMVDDFTIICEEKQMKISLEQKIKKKNLTFDRGKFEQVLKNIIGNAYKMTPNKGKISVYLTEDKNQYTIEVKDTGPGIHKDKQEIIFEKFQQLETGLKKRYSGSGLGLNIVKKIVEYFGGKVWVESAGIPGKGSSFFFTIQKKLPKKIELQSVT